MNTLRRLAASIQRFLGDEPSVASAAEAPSLKLMASRPLGGHAQLKWDRKYVWINPFTISKSIPPLSIRNIWVDHEVV